MNLGKVRQNWLFWETGFTPLHWKGQIILQEFLAVLHQNHSCNRWGIRSGQLASAQPLCKQQTAFHRKQNTVQMINYLQEVTNLCEVRAQTPKSSIRMYSVFRLNPQKPYFWRTVSPTENILFVVGGVRHLKNWSLKILDDALWTEGKKHCWSLKSAVWPSAQRQQTSFIRVSHLKSETLPKTATTHPILQSPGIYHLWHKLNSCL